VANIEGSSHLASSVQTLLAVGALDLAIKCVVDGSLTRSSGPERIDAVALGLPAAKQAISLLVAAWRKELGTLDGPSFALVLRAMSDLSASERAKTARPGMVWTGPEVRGSLPRLARQVVKDMIADAHRELLIVAYWIAGPADGEGIVVDVIERIADAVRRGVRTTMILDCQERPYGGDNRQALLSLWPEKLELPGLYTWLDVRDEEHLKLHAKVLVVDERECLVGSANLTMHALDRNMELGVRLHGSVSKRISDHFKSLIRERVLVPYEA
jgi:phosphatidylserine/phosphatidylglycerophosphate/cardiolipin synthase-like enzyme